VGSPSDLWSVDTCQSWVRAPSRSPVVSLSKKLYSHCLVLVGSRNGLKRDLHKHKNCLFHNRTKINWYKLIFHKIHLKKREIQETTEDLFSTIHSLVNKEKNRYILYKHKITLQHWPGPSDLYYYNQYITGKCVSKYFHLLSM